MYPMHLRGASHRCCFGIPGNDSAAVSRNWTIYSDCRISARTGTGQHREYLRTAAHALCRMSSFTGRLVQGRRLAGNGAMRIPRIRGDSRLAWRFAAGGPRTEHPDGLPYPQWRAKSRRCLRPMAMAPPFPTPPLIRRALPIGRHAARTFSHHGGCGIASQLRTAFPASPCPAYNRDKCWSAAMCRFRPDTPSRTPNPGSTGSIPPRAAGIAV